ncbi:hypothetical protein SDC9_178351 [bioreactor metagenome]|uniref:Uncharacterized protein n=1 Tax=bioreactor metagenome TaxID=1076179 RepID=A0A645GWZ2_9ZZZZ
MREHLQFSCNHFSENVLLSALNYKEFKALQDLNLETLKYIRALKKRSILSAIERGELRSDTDIELFMHVIYVMCYGLMRLAGDPINDLSAARQEAVITLFIGELTATFGNPDMVVKRSSNPAKTAQDTPVLRPATIKALSGITPNDKRSSEE